MSALYWQAVKDYKWRVLRLSVLLTVLSILIVATIPSTYIGTAKLQFLTLKTVPANSASLPFAEAIKNNELTSNFEEVLLENVAKSVLAKLRKFKLTDVDNDLKKALTEYVVIAQIKQKVRAILPFMPQQDPEPLSPKQLGMLKNNYTLEHIIQNLHLSSSTQNELSIEYKDRSAHLAIIIAKLAAEKYLQSVAETKVQISEHVQQIKINTLVFAHSASSADRNIQIGNYTTRLLKPNRTLIVSMSFFISLLVMSYLVLILVRIQAADRQKNASSPLIKSGNSNT